jgi:Ca-activated chloride channel homolog
MVEIDHNRNSSPAAKIRMRMTSTGKVRNDKAVKNWQAIPAILVLAVMALGGSAAPVGAQQTVPPATTAPTIRATVQIVNVPVTALTRRGQRVIDLDQDEVKVFEDGVEQKITHFERETHTPLRIGLILDTSNSSRARLSYEKDAAQQFVDLILAGGGTKTQVFLETFDSSSSIVQDFTSDPDLLSEKVEGLKSGGGKALYDAVYVACREKLMNTGPREEVRRVLVVVSDGLDVQSQHTLDQTISMARMAETMIFTVGTAAYGYSNPGDKLLAEMATDTGGYPSFPLRDAPGADEESGALSHGQIGDTSQNAGLGAATGELSAERMSNLVEGLQAIGHELGEQYTIAYRPTRDAMDGTYRAIKVATTRRGVTLRWKPGYFATAEGARHRSWN